MSQDLNFSRCLKTSFSSACESYLTYYASGNSTTSRGKRRDLERFVTFLTNYCAYSKAEKLTLGDWTTSSVEAFVRTIIEEGEAPATAARRLATLKHFGRTLEDQLTNFLNPAKTVKTPKVQNKATRIGAKLKIEEIESVALQRLDDKDSFIRNRNKALFYFILDTGLRPEEVRKLKRGQLDTELTWVNSIRTKSGKFRNIALSGDLQKELSFYLELRKAELKRFYNPLRKEIDLALPLFISNYGAKTNNPDSFQLGAKTLWRAINELSDSVQLHPHLLRHAHAARLIERSSDISSAAEQLGHTDVRLTKKYLNT